MIRRVFALLFLVGCAPPIAIDDAGAPDVTPASELPTRFDVDGGPDLDGREPLSPELVDVGNVPVTRGDSPLFGIDLPPNTRGFTLYAFGSVGNHLVLSSLISPSGTVFVDDEAPPDLGPTEESVARGFPASFFSPNRAVASSTEGAFLVPITPDLAIESGQWTARMSVANRVFSDGSFFALPVDDLVRVFVVFHGPEIAIAAVDLSLHLTGGNGLDAASAATDPRVLAALDEVDRLLAPASIQIGTVDFVDVDPALATITLEDDLCEGGDLDLLLAAGSARDTLNLFFIERFRCSVFGGIDLGPNIVGLTGGLPGMATIPNSPHGGVAIATNFVVDEPARLGKVIAHEMAHFLGLFHTMESDRFGGARVFDPIADTPDDPEDAAENLMHFFAEGEGLSDGQGTILRQSRLMKERP